MKKKNLSLGIVLTFLFDAFGIIYTSLAGFLFFLILGLNQFLNPAELMVLKPNTITISSSGGMRGKVTTSPQWEFSTKHLLVYIVTGVISKTILLYWTYNVIKEKKQSSFK